MPNVESIRITLFDVEGRCAEELKFHPLCWCLLPWEIRTTGHPVLVETDGALRCSECRGRMDRAD